jgi:two-component system, chemotaxis family, CheB/CheR fusion protein
MQVVGTSNLGDYIARLEANHDEVVFLFRDLLIRVTSFFRDKETFETLESLVIPRLFDGKAADGAVRIWVPGCATGEEAYSLAILLRERMDELTALPKVHIFATDIDDSSIGTARLGRYPSTLLEGLSPKRRERFFHGSHGSFVVAKEIRDLCTFSAHNLVRDPPFSRMELVSCRNLLIYMDTKLQGAIIPMFHRALVPGGILLLGGSESVSRHEHLFAPLDKASRVFKRRDASSPPLNLPLANGSPMARPLSEDDRLQAINWIEATRRREASAGGHTQHSSSEESSASAPSDAPSVAAVKLNSFRTRLDTLLKLLPPSTEGLESVRQELLTTHEELHSLSEEHQTALEELRSTNEELYSVNEEMQSSNEELETSKEELQSLNEELHTVNVRLSEKVEELDEANSDLRNLFESTEIATVFLDRHLIIRNFTPAILTLYNLIPSDEGRPLTDIVSRLDYEGVREDVARVLETVEPLERRIARKDRSTNYIMRILPYREPDSTVSGVLVTFIDVTSILQAEEALREADRRKDVFLATLAHELRNPLAPIRTAARLLKTPNLDHDQLARAQGIISRQVTHMSSLLDDLLDVSRITRGAFVLKKDRVEVKELLEGAVEAIQPQIVAKRHTLRVEIPEVPIVLEADPVRLTQVLSNLLANAAKYTPVGGLITIGGRLEPEDLFLFVRDNGIGLAPAMIPRVFDMFTQVEATGTASDGGLGIGLSLAKGLVQLHGGRISAVSAGLGHGSEFIVSLPRSSVIRIHSSLEHVVGHAATSTSRRVLIADDNRDAAEVLDMVLRSSGHEVHLAHTGQEALEEAERLKPDVAVLDIGMPDLNGYEVAQRIRLEPWGARVILIALTGWGQEEDKRRAEAAGFDHHCTKPVDPDDLERFFSSRGKPS